MKKFVGLDVSQKIVVICVLDEAGKIVWEGSCDSHPNSIVRVIKKRAPNCSTVAFETGPLAVWHWHTLKEAGLPIACIHARHVHAAIALQINKTDRNDAYAIAQIARSGWFKPVEMKSFDSHRVRLLLTARSRVVSMRTTLYSQIRGVLKTFGIVLPPGKGAVFEKLAYEAVSKDQFLLSVIGPLLDLWRNLSSELRKYNREVSHIASQNVVCKNLMTTPGIGTLTALAFISTVDNPERFHRSEDVGAYLGLTPRRYQSGDVDRSGGISKCGDRFTRSLLFEAAHILLTRSKGTSSLQEWGKVLTQRVGHKKAKVAVARRLAVVMHRMWINGTSFNPSPQPA